MNLAQTVLSYPSKAAAARAMNIPVSTLKSRLSRAPTSGRVVPIRQQAVQREPRRAHRSEWYASGNRIIHDGPGGGGNLLELERLPENVLIFSCTQAPFHHPDAAAFLAMVKAAYNPDLTVCAGDELDLQCLKKAFMGADSPGPLAELEQGKRFIATLARVFPRLILLTSNHVKSRIKFAQAQGNIPSPMLRDWREVIDAPIDWVWRDYLIMRNWLIEHGHDISRGSRGTLTEQTTLRFGRPLSIVRGHIHSEHGDFIKPIWVTREQQIRLVYASCLMDPSKVSYTRSPTVLGCVVLVRGVPHPVPLIVDRQGRWVGRLVEW